LYRRLLADASFHELLLAFDRDLAARERAGGCPRCGGVLHAAPFWRKPRGVPQGLDEEHARRFSFCCAGRECRKRKTPPSLRFLGAKVYSGVMVVVASALQGGGMAARQLARLVGVNRRTIARWRSWWRAAFTASSFWRVAAAAFMPPVNEAALPGALLERFAGASAARMLSLLRFLLPITGGRAVQVC
jgi:hypothetical protein